jgi:ABC-three component (ABC-3C) system Middle Component 3
MTAWTARSREEAYLLNPSFCALIAWSSAVGFRGDGNDGMPYVLPFVAIPLTLHRPTRQALPRSVRTSMPAWIEENTYFRIGFAERANSLAPFVREALLFGAVHGLFAFDDERRLVPAPKLRALSRYLREATDEVRECVKKAELVGKWLAASGSVETTMALWGVKP